MTTILVVDDEVNLVELIQGYLEREGFAAVRTTQDLAGRDRVVEGRRPA